MPTNELFIVEYTDGEIDDGEGHGSFTVYLDRASAQEMLDCVEDADAKVVRFVREDISVVQAERQRAAVRFLRYSSAVPCAECGRMSKHHWSMIVALQAKIFPKGIGGFIQSHGMVHLPLTPVCRDHLLQELDKPTYMRPYIEPTKTKKPRRRSSEIRRDERACCYIRSGG